MSDYCACACGYDDDGPAVFDARMVKARTPRTCCECHAEIPPGARYERAKGLWDGSWATYETCAPCVAIRRDYCRGGGVFGMLRADIRECLGLDIYDANAKDD